MLGLDEHSFSKKAGFATTFCDLRTHKVFDVVQGRSESGLADYLKNLGGKDRVKVVCIDLSSTYRNLIRNHFPNAMIVADRFHVIRLLQHQCNQGRSAGINAILSTQSISDLLKAGGQAFVGQVLNNCNNYVIQRQNNPEDSETLSKVVGTKDNLEYTSQVLVSKSS